MTSRAIFLFAWVALIASAAMASEAQRTRIDIAIDDGGGEQRVFKFDSDDSGFNLDELAVGESRTIDDGSGNEATISRTEDGFEVEVAGETISLGGHDGHHDLEMMAEHHADTVHKRKRVHMIRTEADDGVTVISGSELDETTRERIREVLRDAGKAGDVMFLDGSELHDGSGTHGHREVRIIRKETDKTN